MFFKKKQVAAQTNAPMDLEEVMKKYDRESNVRTWDGVPKILVNIALASFALFCIYVTLFTNWMEWSFGMQGSSCLTLGMNDGKILIMR